MANESVLFDPIQEIDRYLDDSALAITEMPGAAIIDGGVSTGKTALRRAAYFSVYVSLDAAELFLSVYEGEDLDFPGRLEQPTDLIAFEITQRFCRERLHFVTGMIGGEIALLTQLLETIKAAGYQSLGRKIWRG